MKHLKNEERNKKQEKTKGQTWKNEERERRSRQMENEMKMCCHVLSGRRLGPMRFRYAALCPIIILPTLISATGWSHMYFVIERSASSK